MSDWRRRVSILKKLGADMRNWVIALVVLMLMWGAGLRPAVSVQTSYVEHDTEKQFVAGEPNGVLISSEGQISLAQKHRELMGESVGDVWVVNALVKGLDGSLYVATSGEGYLYRLRGGGEPAEIIYGEQEDSPRHIFSLALDNEGRLLAGTGGGESAKLLRFEDGRLDKVLFEEEGIKYIWSIVVGRGGRIYLGTGPTGKVLTLAGEGSEAEVLYKAKEKNILSLALDMPGMLYAGGDERGLIFRIDPGSKQVRVVFDSERSEISALVFDEEGNLYACTADAAGARPGVKLVLSDGEPSRPEQPDKKQDDREEKKDNETEAKEKSGEGKAEGEKSSEKKSSDEKSPEAAVIGEEEQKAADEAEVTGAGEDQEGKSADKLEEQVGQDKDEKEQGEKEQGEKESEQGKSEDAAEQVKRVSAGRKDAAEKKLTPAATPEASERGGPAGERVERPSEVAARRPSKGNDVYKITPQGYVTTIFSKPVVILSMVYAGGGELLLGTGNDGRLLRLNVDKQEAVVLHEVKDSVQVSALCVGGGQKVYAGCANPGRVLLVEKDFAAEGYYDSEVIDAGQITSWGKMQIEADMPADTQVAIATRGGNTSDPQNGGWQSWSEQQRATEDIAMLSDSSRFVQYRLFLRSGDGLSSPLVRRVKLAHLVPNLPPKLQSVQVARSGKGAGGSVSKNYKISYKAVDENKDELSYKIFIRPMGAKRWVRILKDQETKEFDSLTAADGRYEFKVEVSDAKSNAVGEELTDSRISEPVVIDNTPPEVVELSHWVSGDKVRVRAKVRDRLSVIKSVSYSVNSSEKWQMVPVDDGVFDSLAESVSFDFEVDEQGEHLLTVYFEDALGNRVYRNLVVEIE